MSSLNETFDSLAQFSQALNEFNEAMKASHAEVADKHEALKGIWDDQAAHEYEKVYEPVEATLTEYVNHTAPRLEEFLQTKLRMLDTYLNGS
jgi:uncharacterized protein YukE